MLYLCFAAPGVHFIRIVRIHQQTIPQISNDPARLFRIIAARSLFPS
jgi:hypothetical protein